MLLVRRSLRLTEGIRVQWGVGGLEKCGRGGGIGISVKHHFVILCLSHDPPRLLLTIAKLHI